MEVESGRDTEVTGVDCMVVGRRESSLRADEPRSWSWGDKPNRMASSATTMATSSPGVTSLLYGGDVDAEVWSDSLVMKTQLGSAASHYKRLYVRHFVLNLGLTRPADPGRND
jgi:hypothetical protein